MSRWPLATNRSRQATTRYDQARRCNTPGIRRLSQDTVEWMRMECEHTGGQKHTNKWRKEEITTYSKSTVWKTTKEHGLIIIYIKGLGYCSQHQISVFILTWSLAVVWVDNEDTDDEELQAPPHNFPQQWAACRACTQLGVDWQCNGCPHYKHKPGGEKIRQKRRIAFTLID